MATTSSGSAPLPYVFGRLKRPQATSDHVLLQSYNKHGLSFSNLGDLVSLQEILMGTMVKLAPSSGRNHVMSSVLWSLAMCLSQITLHNSSTLFNTGYPC
ncbi:hypothetical protein K443DRAFT_679735, partial [Laccaria amethystina LaAM-08-1]